MFASLISNVLFYIYMAAGGYITIVMLTLLLGEFITGREFDKNLWSVLLSTECGWLVGMVAVLAGLVLTHLFPKMSIGVLAAMQVVGFGLGLIAARAAYLLISSWDDDGSDAAVEAPNGDVVDRDAIPESFADLVAESNGERRKPTLEDYVDALSGAATDVSTWQQSHSKRRIEKENHNER